MAKLTIIRADVSSDELCDLARVALDRVGPPAPEPPPAALPAPEPAAPEIALAPRPPSPSSPSSPPPPKSKAKPKPKAKAKPAGERRCEICGGSLAHRGPLARVCSDDCRKAKAARQSRESHARKLHAKDSPRAVPCANCDVLYGAEELDADGLCKRCLRLATDH